MSPTASPPEDGCTSQSAAEQLVAQERVYLARRTRDSIAQSLAFIKIQVQLMRDALRAGDPESMRAILEEIDTGESYGDVRELLVHTSARGRAARTSNRRWRPPCASSSTRAASRPRSPSKGRACRSFPTRRSRSTTYHSGGLVQRPRSLRACVAGQPEGSAAAGMAFRSAGRRVGFELDEDRPDETHVGLRIMRERAQTIGARLDIVSAPGKGSSVILTLPPNVHPVSSLAYPGLPSRLLTYHLILF